MSPVGNEDENAPKRVTAIRVCGFKSIATEQRIELGPLTILAGANSSGKSSIMQPLLLLKQTMEAPFDSGPLLLDGPNLSVSRFDQLLSRAREGGATERYTLTFECSSWGEIALHYARSAGQSLYVEWKCDDREWGGHCGPIRIGMTDQQIRSVLPKGLDQLAHQQGAVGSWEVLAGRQFSHFGGALLANYVTSMPYQFAPRHIIRVDGLALKLIHVPARRVYPDRAHPGVSIGPLFGGTFERYVGSVVALWQEAGDPRHDALAEALRRLGLTYEVQAERIDDANVRLLVGRTLEQPQTGGADLVPIADVGFGVSQALSALVALLAAERDQVVYLEDPEAHIHPRAVQQLAVELVAAANRGVCLVVETHSDVLLRGIQTLVATEEIAPESVKLYWFTRDAVSGATEVTEAGLDENGAYGDWPTDFDDVALDVEGGYLDAVERRAAK